MIRSFHRIIVFLAISLAILALPGRASAAGMVASALCQTEGESAERAALEAFLAANLQEHSRYSFTRDLKEEVKKLAKDFLDQRIYDRRAELCATRLKLVEDSKAPGNSGCAAVAELLDPYMRKAAMAYDENKKCLELRRQEHMKALQRKLFEIASGSTTTLEGVTYRGYALIGAPKALKFEWLKLVAGQLGAEIHKVWGAVETDKNLMMRANVDFAREAVVAKRESDNARRQPRGALCAQGSR